MLLQSTEQDRLLFQTRAGRHSERDSAGKSPAELERKPVPLAGPAEVKLFRVRPSRAFVPERMRDRTDPGGHVRGSGQSPLAGPEQ